ncbi:MAG: hypothetical protein WBB85_09265 [Albidovulum sp.]|uniref:hypothetical protein n=1 Tax=Albidovulum sp. TaxID=1872424 RepID=UPI003C8585EA
MPATTSCPEHKETRYDQKTDQLEIETHLWDEADLTTNNRLVAHIDSDLSGGDAFRHVEEIAEEIEADKATSPA